MINADDFKRGMRRLAAGVSIITTSENGTQHGFVATSVSSVAAEPYPSLLVCVNQHASSHDVICRSGVFCVNILSDTDMETARRFSSPNARETRFQSCSWVPLLTGAPALSDALASFDCEVASSIHVHSHTIFIGEVKDLRLWKNEIAPLLYVDGRYETLSAAM